MMIKLKLREDIDADYKGSYSDIERETFDKIVSLDPTARPNQLGTFAKQLLLRCYKSGDIEFLNRPEEVKTAIQNFIRNVRSNKDVEGKYKNPSYYKTVGDFIDFVNDPTKEIEGAAKEEQPKENKLDKIYNSYYKDKLSREDFDKIVSIEDDKLESLGLICKNFILPKFINGSDADKSYILNNIDKLKTAVIKFNKNRNSLNTEHQNLDGFETIEDFININVNGESSTLVNYLRGLGSQVWAECNYLGSTILHDIFQPTTRRAAAYIAGGDYPSLWAGPKGYCDFKNWHNRIQDKSSPDAYSYPYYETAFAHWCTVDSGNYWTKTTDSYRGSSEGIYYDIMAKGSALWENNRKANYQFGIGPDGTRYGAADGEEDWDHASLMFPRLIKEDPEILGKFLEISESNPAHRRLGLMKQVAEYRILKEFGSKPLLYNKNTMSDLLDKFNSLETIKMIVKEVIIEEGVVSIPAAEFHGWTALEKITFPKSLKKIRAQAFKGCISLQLLELPPELEYIGGQAFASCINLHGTIQIPMTLTYIGDKAFEDTNVKAFSISSNKEEGSILIHPDDWDLYAKKAKIVKSNENESLNEDILDENIPYDLARAYSNVYYRQDLPGSTIDILPGSGKRRRQNKYDYKNSEYREISKEEALQLLRADRANAKYLRFLYKDQLIQFENNAPGEVHPVYGSDVGLEVVDSHGNVRFKRAKQCTMNQLVNSVDKVYWTDEYDHPLSDEKKATRDSKSSRITGVGASRISVPDTGEHTDGILDRTKTIVDTRPDDVSIRVATSDGEELNQSDIRSKILDYTNVFRATSKLKKKYSDVMKVYRYYKDNSDEYEPEEINDILGDIIQKLKETQSSYMEQKQKLQNIMVYINIAFNEDFVHRYNEAKNNFIRLKSDINRYEKVIADSESWLREHKNDNIKDNPKYKQLTATMENSKEKIVELKGEQEEIKASMDEWEAQIKELQAKIEHGKNRIIQIDNYDLPTAIETADKLQAEVEDNIEDLVEETSKEITRVQSDLLAAKKWFVDHPGLGRTYTLPNKPEMNPEVATKFKQKEATDKFGGLSFDQLKEIFTYNFDNDVVNLQDDGSPFVTPFLDMGATQSFNSFNELYNYWSNEEGLSQIDVDNWIIKYLEAFNNNRQMSEFMIDLLGDKN